MFRPNTTASFGRTTTPQFSLLAHSSSESAFDLLATTPSTREQVLSRENLSVGQKSQRLLRLATQPHQITPDSSSVLPKAQDIAKLIRNLNAVASPGAATSSRRGLQEAVPTRLHLQKDAVQYFCIATKGRPVPLAVTIDKREGSVRCYLSKTVAEPSALLADFIFKQLAFKVTDSGYVFKCSYVYLAVHAVSQFEGTLHIQFGGSQPAKSSARVAAQLRKSPPKPMAKSARSEKNFMKLNLDPVPLNSASRQAFHVKKAQEWLVRRKLAVEKKERTIQHKKARTIAWLNKQELNRLREKQMREETAELQVTQARQRQWFTLIYFVHALEKLRNSTCSGRSFTLSRLRRATSIRRIQTAYKTLGPAKYALQVSLLRASNLLLCYWTTCSQFAAPKSQDKLVAFTKDSFFRIALSKKLERLTQCVICIQEAWRNAMKKTREQPFLLGMLWNEVAAKMSSEAKKKKRVKASQKLLAISLQDKNDCLVEYLMARKRKYQRIIQLSLTENVLKRAQIASAFTTKTAQSLVRDALPPFNFLPTEEKMRKLIRSALNSK